MKVLVINSGSSSIKYELFDMHNETALATGAVERIGGSDAIHRLRVHGDAKSSETVTASAVGDHREGLVLIAAALKTSAILHDLAELSAIGHRVVHGGEHFRQPTLIDTQVLAKIKSMSSLAPLHNPANALGIELMLQQAPNVPQVAVFDTAFHQTMPEYAYRYALPESLYIEQHVRRYGFHGTSHLYVAKQAARYLNKPLQSLHMITLHLGNGASATAIANGRSVDTSMGMTPLQGLIMGTRCGDIDPAIVTYLSRTCSLNDDELDNLLNSDSGLKGICGSNDMREVHALAEAGNRQARLALEMYGYRTKKYIGAYAAVLGRLDAMVFTGGVGENDAWLREYCCSDLQLLGVAIDTDKNNSSKLGAREIQHVSSAVAVLVIPTDEEFEIAVQTLECLG